MNKDIQGQYMDYPYPVRDPEDERFRLLKSGGDYLGEINHWLFNGDCNFQNDFRVLVAGGGTGDSVIYLADQLRNTSVEIVYLDFSANSMEIAKKRAEIRGLKNITWVNDSLLNRELDLGGEFDYIQCSGVLHHLANPDEGLKVLVDRLKHNGGMTIMVYGQYGRTGLYQVQDVLRMINKDAENREEEVRNAWSIVNDLPETNWFNMNESPILLDHIQFGDSGLYDMFLHKQDRAYTIPELYDFIEQSGLHFVDFIEGHIRGQFNLSHYIKDPDLLQNLLKRSKKEQDAIVELLCGTFVKHSVFVSKSSNSVATFDMDYIPYFYVKESTPRDIAYTLHTLGPPPEGAKLKYSWSADGYTHCVFIPISKYSKSLFTALIENNKSVADIQAFIIRDGFDISESELMEELSKILPLFENEGALLYKRSGINFDSYIKQKASENPNRSIRITY